MSYTITGIHAHRVKLRMFTLFGYSCSTAVLGFPFFNHSYRRW